MAQLSIQFICRSEPLVSLRVLKGGIHMRITDDQNVNKVKDINPWAAKTSRVQKAHKDEFEEQLADGINERKSKVKTKIKKGTKKEHQNLVDGNQELDEEKANNNNQFSSWD